MTKRSNASNTCIEQYYFEQFRAHFPLPPAEVMYGDKPDVILRGATRIGVEITRLYLVDGKDPASEQRQNQWRQTVLDSAQAKYLEVGGKRSELTVSFDPRRPIRDPEAVGRALLAVMPKIEVCPEGEVRREVYASIPELDFVYHNPREYEDAQWRLAQVYTTPTLAVERLREVVKSKQSKMKDYQPCDTFWLLVIVDIADRAQDQDIRWPRVADPIFSQFERIIVYNPQFAEWTDVPIRH